jgi:hypothetical protein
VPGDRPRVRDSSGVTEPSALLIHSLRGVRPREIMSSVNDDSLEKLFSTRAATKVPAPWRRVSRPSLTRPSSALRTVMREMLNSSAMSRSAGRASSGARIFFWMASRSARCSCL